MLGWDLRKKLIFGVPVAIAIVVLTMSLRGRTPKYDPNSAYWKSVHEVSKEARPPGVTNPYSYDFPDEAVAISESKKCEGCHGDMLDKEDGKPKYRIHNAMLRHNQDKGKDAVPLGLRCVHCHKKVDLGKRNGKKVTMRVDRKQCTTCHELKQKELDDVMKEESGSPIGTRNLIANHGIDKKSARKWLTGHRSVAGVIGAVKCRRCHSFNSELDVCSECHKGWHGRNWKGRHYQAVKELGIKRCKQCHVPGTKMEICADFCHGTSPLLSKGVGK